MSVDALDGSGAGRRAAGRDLANADWPHHAASRFVEAAGMRWHVQVMGEGPALLLLHGTGASTHSWRDLMPILARRFTVVAPDLPGHGFSGPAPTGGATLPGMAAGVARLLDAIGLRPARAVGHSAGAAIALRMSLDPPRAIDGVVGLNAALLALRGPAGFLFAASARIAALAPFTPHLFAWRASDGRAVERLLASTGSKLDAAGKAYYARLLKRPSHIAGALAMMANWDLDAFERELPKVTARVLLAVGMNDGTVPPTQADVAARRIPHADIARLPGLGHLAHEERPEEIAALIERWVAAVDKGRPWTPMTPV